MGGTAADPGITTGALARRLGVSPTTLRSWDRRYGLGPRVHQGGRHRRWTPQDVARVETMCRLTAEGIPPAEAARSVLGPTGPRPAATAHRAALRPGRGAASGGGGLPMGTARQEARGLSRAAVRLDAPAVQRSLNDLVAQYGVVTAWEEVMVPVLHAVGRKWETSEDRYVEVEHLLSWHIGTSLRRIPQLREEPRGAAPVVAACVPGEQHTLALEALVAALGERGVPTRMLGGAVPAGALEAAVRRTGPCAVVLWSQTRSSANLPLASELARLRWGVRGARSAATVVVAGPGWAGRSHSGLLRPNALREAIGLLEGVSGHGVDGRSPEEPDVS